MDLLDPAAAGLVQSELRLLSRDLQEISWKLGLKLGQLQVGAGGRRDRGTGGALTTLARLSQIYKD